MSEYIYRQGTPEQCEFILGAYGVCEDDGTPTGNPKVILCPMPARIKRNGRWFCADHFDQVEKDDPFSGTQPGDVVALD